MYHANFCIKYEDSGSPEKSSGTALFYLYDKYYACHLCYFISPCGNGFDQSGRGLAALYYVVCPAAEQVVCWHLNFLLPKPQLTERLSGGQELKAERVSA